MTETNTPATAPRPARWAQIASDVLSPLLLPTYAMTMAMWLTPLRVLPESTRLVATAAVAISTALLPALAIVLLMRLGVVSDRAISDRRQRRIPYTVAAVCYLGTAWMMLRFGAPGWLLMFFAGAALATTIDLAVSVAWKISAHTTGIGGLAGMTAWVALHSPAHPSAMIWLSVMMLLTGLVASARIELRRHTLGQVLAGAAVGLTAVFASMQLTAIFQI